MATEEGLVIELKDENAVVLTSRTSACKHCSSSQSCSSKGGGTEMRVEADNAVDAQVGDRVVLSVETASLLKASFLIYVFPILCMIAGASIGQYMAPGWDLNPSGTSAVGGFGALFGALAFIKSKGNRLGKKAAYKPRIIRIQQRSVLRTTPASD